MNRGKKVTPENRDRQKEDVLDKQDTDIKLDINKYNIQKKKI